MPRTLLKILLPILLISSAAGSDFIGGYPSIENLMSKLNGQDESLIYDMVAETSLGDLNGDGVKEILIESHTGCNANCPILVAVKAAGEVNLVLNEVGMSIEAISLNQCPDYIQKEFGKVELENINGYKIIHIENSSGSAYGSPQNSYYAFNGKKYVLIGSHQLHNAETMLPNL